MVDRKDVRHNRDKRNSGDMRKFNEMGKTGEKEIEKKMRNKRDKRE